MGSCSPIPTDGPSVSSVEMAAEERVTGAADGTDGSVPFVLVDANAQNVEMLIQANRRSYFKGEFIDRREAADIRIGLGDKIRVTIFEAGSGGLFVPATGALSAGNFVSIPDQEVDRTGSITVPYAAKGNDGGVINVYNRRPIEVQAEIEERLSDRAIEPQVIVTVMDRTSNLFSVIGDVKNPGRYPVPQGGIRLLDAMGAAGGPEGADYETMVTLQRAGVSATARLTTLINAPENNIYVRPNDTISLKKEGFYYNILGAVNESGRIPFEEENVMLANAIAEAGGLDIERSDAHEVLIYREEHRTTLKELGAEIKHPKLLERKMVPTVYRINLREPKGIFVAQKMQLHHNDMIYVANHPIAGIARILAIVRDILLIRLLDD